MLSQINVHNVSPADVSLGAPDSKTVTLRLGEISVYITDTAVLDALHEATTRAYELLVEGVLAS